MKKIMLFAILAICLLSLAGCTSAQSSESGAEGVGEQKFMRSRDTVDFSVDREVFDSVDELLKRGDCVVIVSFTEKPREIMTYSEDFIYQPSDDEDALEMTLEIWTSKYTLKVHEVVSGEIDSDKIVFTQMGKYESDEYETKLKPDTQYVLFLCKRNYEKDIAKAASDERMLNVNAYYEKDRIMYQANHLENGIFEIKPDGTLYAYDDVFAPAYGGKPLETLLDAIRVP